MVKDSKSSSSQPYAEYFQRENVKKVFLEHIESDHFREYITKSIKAYHCTDEFREKLFQQIDEYKSTRLGKFIKSCGSHAVTALISAIISALIAIGICKS